MKTTTLAIAAAMAAGGSAHAQEAVQWRVEDGGNGHWYGLIPVSCGVDWQALLDCTHALGGHLAAVNSEGESAFLSANVVFDVPGRGAMIGAFTDNPLPDPTSAVWQWVTNEEWDYTNWRGPTGAEAYVYMFDHFDVWPPGTWDDCPWGYVPYAVIEFSADCNDDGIVDYGQILDGTFADTNANGVPDCCDEGVSCDPCPGDVNFDGIVNGADISVLLGFWGLNGKPVAADINKDGQVDGTDLANVLGSWGECPCEGTTR